jgi:hypothetical protein
MKEELPDANFFTQEQMKNIRLWPASQQLFG